ncbi:MAG TPA: outer membrane protein assembly factor BamD [Pyrinomonadaceae bacterium]|jgi:outer membrane protein assembly factor BamD (BamD/ComL family)|nr:outer membrane protein assembly factor BamD [Pyrinomonadaceae bacterium]
MRRAFISFLFAALTVVTFNSLAAAQRNVTPAIERDPLLEQDAKHNLDVARQAFTPLKKAYKQVLLRFDETYAAYPDFSQMDEFLYLAGMSSYYLSENKGKQKVDIKSEKEMKRFAPDKLHADAVAYLSMLVDKYPQSKFRPDAEKTLDELKAKQ